MQPELLVSTLQAAYPKQHLTNATLAIYAADLADIDDDILTQAIVTARRTIKFFPTIAEIREIAVELHLQAPDPAEAWQQALGKYGAHPLVDEARRLTGHAWPWRTAEPQ